MFTLIKIPNDWLPTDINLIWHISILLCIVLTEQISLYKKKVFLSDGFLKSQNPIRTQ